MLAIQDKQFFNAQLTKLEKFSETIKKLNSEDPNLQENLIDPLLEILYADNELFNPDVIRERYESQEIKTCILRIPSKPKEEKNKYMIIFMTSLLIESANGNEKTITKKMEDMLVKNEEQEHYLPYDNDAKMITTLFKSTQYCTNWRLNYPGLLINFLKAYYKERLKEISILKKEENLALLKQILCVTCAILTIGLAFLIPQYKNLFLKYFCNKEESQNKSQQILQ